MFELLHNLTGTQPPREALPHRSAAEISAAHPRLKPEQAVELIEQFLASADGQLLPPEYQQLFTDISAAVARAGTKLKNEWWLQLLPTDSSLLEADEIRAKTTLQEFMPLVPVYIERFQEFLQMFDGLDRLPEYSLRLAKYGEQTYLNDLYQTAHEQGQWTVANLQKLEERKDLWFGGMEKMTRVAKLWRLLNLDQTRAGSAQSRPPAEFVTAAYQLIAMSAEDEIAKYQAFVKLIAPYQPTTPSEYLYLVATGESERWAPQFASKLQTLINGPEFSQEIGDPRVGAYEPYLAFVANPRDVVAGYATKVGETIKIKLSQLWEPNQIDNKTIKWVSDKLAEVEGAVIASNREQERPDHPSVWLSFDFDFNQVMGADSSLSQLIAETGKVDRSLVTMALPLSIQQARSLLTVSEELTPQFMSSWIVECYLQRALGVAKWHGFGAWPETYANPAWATVDNSAAGNTDKSLQANNQILNKATLAAMTEGMLVECFYAVMGSMQTGVAIDAHTKAQDSAASMERAAYYLSLVMEGMTFYSQNHAAPPAVGIGHSMGGEIALLLAAIMPRSVVKQRKIYLEAHTPVATDENPWQANSFLYERFNLLANLLIAMQGRRSPRLVQETGRLLSLAGRRLPITKALVGGMVGATQEVNRNALRETFSRVANLDQLADWSVKWMHELTFANFIKFLELQKDTINDPTWIGIDQMLGAAAANMGSLLGVTIGTDDKVLKPEMQQRSFAKHPDKYRWLDFTGEEWRPHFTDWLTTARQDDGPLACVIQGVFPHYMINNWVGRAVAGGRLAQIKAAQNQI